MNWQSFETASVLRLEVEVTPTGLVNLVPNPDGALGGWGWPTAVGTMSGDPSLGLTYTAPSPSTAAYFATEPMPIAAGEYAAAAWDLTAITGYVRVRFEWLNSSYGVLSSSTQSGYLNTVGTAAYGPVVAPASTAFVRLRFDHYSNTSAANPAAGATVTLTNVKVAKAATSGALGSTRTNLVPNPSFETSNASWVGIDTTIVRSTAQAYVGSASLALTSFGTATAARAYVYAEVTGGRDYTVQFRSRAASVARVTYIGIEWLDAGLQLVAVNKANGPSNSTSGWVQHSGMFTAPAGASYMRLTVGTHTSPTSEVHYIDAVMVTQGTDLPVYFDGSTAGSGTKTYAWTGTTNLSTSTLTDTTLGSLVPTEWRNIAGSSCDFNVDREELNLGTLSVQIADDMLDPATTSVLRPGRRIQLVALEPTLETWEPIFVGRLTGLPTTYDEAFTLPAEPAHISLSAVDATKALAAARRPNGVATMAELADVLEDANVPWRINGSGNQVPSATVVSTVENAKAIDQIAITRDSSLGRAWLDRFGILNALDYATNPTLTNPGFEVNTTGWAGGTNTTIARVTTPVRTGAGSLRVTRTTSTGTASASTPTGTSGFPVVAGHTYTASLYSRAAATSRTVLVELRFYDAAGSLIGAQGSGIANSTSAWTQTSQTFTAPVGSKYAGVSAQVLSAATSEIHYIDDVSLTLAGAAYVLDDTVVTDYDTDFSTDGCINVVTIKRILPAVGDEDSKTADPVTIEDLASIANWDRHPAEFTVHGMSEAAVAAYAANILARNATPTVRVNSVQFPIKDASDVARALIDIGDLVRVQDSLKGLDQTLRVARVNHRITVDKWIVTLYFTSPTSVAAPQETPPVQNVGDNGAWTTVTLTNGWTNFGGFQAARYRRMNGIVYVQGMLVPGTNGAAAFTLPAGFRPAANHLFQGNSNSTSLAAGRFDVNSTGTLVPAAAVGWISIECSFPAEA